MKCSPTIEAKGMSDKGLSGKGCGKPLAMMLFCDNDTSGKNPVLKDGEIPMRATRWLPAELFELSFRTVKIILKCKVDIIHCVDVP